MPSDCANATRRARLLGLAALSQAAGGYWNGSAGASSMVCEALRMLEERPRQRLRAHHRLARRRARAVRACGRTTAELFASISRAIGLGNRRANARRLRYDATRQRLEKFNVSLGGGLGPTQGQLFRIGWRSQRAMVLGSLAAVVILDHRRATAKAACCGKEYLSTEFKASSDNCCVCK